MADKKTGYEKAAEAQPTSGSPAAQTAPIVLTRKHKVRKRDNDLLAMNKIDAILEKFEPRTALRVLRYCQDKQVERMNDGITANTQERLPTMTIPGLEERDPMRPAGSVSQTFRG